MSADTHKQSPWPPEPESVPAQESCQYAVSVAVYHRRHPALM